MRTSILHSLVLVFLTTLSACAIFSGSRAPDLWDEPFDQQASFNAGSLSPFDRPDNSSRGENGQPSWSTPASGNPNMNDEDAVQEARLRRRWRTQEAKQQHDLILGMKTDDVAQSWGSPITVETAGHEGTGNERWIYSTSVSSNQGLSPRRIVYFEGGQVVGWDTENR